jgi:hypothetical protein
MLYLRQIGSSSMNIISTLYKLICKSGINIVYFCENKSDVYNKCSLFYKMYKRLPFYMMPDVSFYSFAGSINSIERIEFENGSTLRFIPKTHLLVVV